jgi:penicillin V acylase-like amidase (Ntn superfamily)
MMKKGTEVFMILLVSICLMPKMGIACTTFVLDNGTLPVIGFNFDYSEGSGLVMVNKRGVSKVAVPNPNEPDAKLATWTSKFGSITFNYVSREFPNLGMNEAGLVIEALMLKGGKYSESDSRAILYGPTQWVQYQLDNFSTVEEVIASDKNIRISKIQSSGIPEHFFISDAKGNCANIDFIDGKMVCHTGDSMSVKVLTNSSYGQAVKFFNLFDGFAGTLPIRLSSILIKCFRNPFNNALLRFVCAADMVKKFVPLTSKPAVDYAFDILSSVSEPADSYAPTYWSIVYDAHTSRIYFRTNTNTNIRQIDVASFDFSCTTTVKALDINANVSGDVTNNFVDYTDTMNRDLLKSSIPTITDAALDAFEEYIEDLVCNE